MSDYLDILAVLAAIFLATFCVLTLGHVAGEGSKWWKQRKPTSPNDRYRPKRTFARKRGRVRFAI